MEKKYTYEYDDTCEVLIRKCEDELPVLLRKRDLKWQSVFEKGNDSYARALILGQGCWERLHDISNEKALEILKQWGYKE